MMAIDGEKVVGFTSFQVELLGNRKNAYTRPGKGDPAAEIESKRGEWNTIDLTCKGDSVILKINGKLILEGTAADPSSGRIFFQCYKGELFYRKIEVYDLSEAGK